MSLAVTQVQSGETLAGKYQVERVLGQGGMGVVVAARHVHLGERVAIKLMHPAAAILPDAVPRFIREARAAARLESAHVARVTDVGVLEDQRLYMVMEYLEGTDLEALVAKSGPLPIETAVDYVLQAAEAIAEAHLLGIVHRDLKPSNLFLVQRRDGQPLIKVLDFGISKMVDESQGVMTTTTSSLMGSPLYMSPEQLTAQRDIDGRSDVWSLGVILFELVTGSAPFTAETLPQLCAHILQSEPAALRARLPGAPLELERVVARCLQKSPQARYQSVLELSVALQSLASEVGRVSVERISRLVGASMPASTPRPSLPVANAEIASAEQHRPRWPVVVGALALLLLAAGATFALRSRTSVAPPETGQALLPPAQAAVPVLAETAPEPQPSSALASPSGANTAVASSKSGLRPQFVKRPAPAAASVAPTPARSGESKAPPRAPRDFGGRL